MSPGERQMHGEDIPLEGTFRGWPVWVTLQRNPGEKWVGVVVGCYTDENDNSAPPEISAAVTFFNKDFTTLREAKAHLKRLGFVPDPDNND